MRTMKWTSQCSCSFARGPRHKQLRWTVLGKEASTGQMKSGCREGSGKQCLHILEKVYKATFNWMIRFIFKFVSMSYNGNENWKTRPFLYICWAEAWSPWNTGFLSQNGQWLLWHWRTSKSRANNHIDTSALRTADILEKNILASVFMKYSNSVFS